MRCARLAFGALLVGLFAHSNAAAAGPDWRSWDRGLAEAAATGRPVLVDVYTDWCGWCRRMDRDVYSRPGVQEYLARRFVTVKLDAESGQPARFENRSWTSRALAQRLGVTSYPTTVFLDSKGRRTESVPGYLPPDRFLLLLRYFGDGHAARGEAFGDFVRDAPRGGDGPERDRR
jgi:thioredoxin-related protein